MTIPAADLARIVAFCADASPAEFADQSRVEHEVRGSVVTLVEAAKLDRDHGDVWLRTPLARLTRVADAAWTLHCFDRDSKPMAYDVWEPDFALPTSVDAILAEIDADPTNIFWG